MNYILNHFLQEILILRTMLSCNYDYSDKKGIIKLLKKNINCYLLYKEVINK